MASFNLSISVDACESRKLNFSVYPGQPFDRCSVTSVAGYSHPFGPPAIPSFSKLRHIKVSRSDAEFSDASESILVHDTSESPKNDLVGDTVIAKNPNFGHGVLRAGKSSRNRSRMEKKVIRREKGSIFSSHDLSFVFDKEVDVDLSCTRRDFSIEQCNDILKRLETCSDIKTLRFFAWMRSNGKLMQNVTAYNFLLRVLSRRDDWDAAEKTIQEMSVESACELNFQVFNTLIYACYKRGRVQLGAKWFRLMLDYRVRPNVATFGMLMSLYQKGWNIKEAEFAFSQMRDFGVRCESAYSSMITIYTRMGFYGKAEEVIEFLKKDGVTLNLKNWLVLLNAYGQQGKLGDAELVLASMQEAGFSPNIVAYNTLITGYAKASNMDGAQWLFCNLQNVGLEPDETTYRIMIEGWGRANNYEEAKWYYKELKRLGFKPNSSNSYTLINLQAKHGDEEGALQTIDDMTRMGCQYSSILGCLLQAYERTGRVGSVPSILRGSFYEHVLVNQTSCSILLMAYVKHLLVDDAIDVLRDKKWKDAGFEDNLYHLLICSCKELSHFENAIKIYTHMPKREKPNMHIMCTMIDIYGLMGRFAEAENIYMEMKSSGVSLDMVAFSIVVRMYVKAGFLKDACVVIDRMEKEKSIVPDIYMIRDMLRIYQKCGKLDKLAELYYKILKSGVAWDQEMYNCVINCCARALPVDELSRLLNEMLQRGFVPNTTAYNVILDVYGKSRLLKKAKKVFWMARKQGLVNVISYNTVIAAYGRSKDFKSMSSTVQLMEFHGFSVSLEAYNCMLDAYGKESQIERFKSVLQRMKESRCASDNYTYNIMINIYGEQGWIEEVAGVLTELKESGLGPDLYSYNTLIKAYGIARMVEEAVELVKEMRERGIEPDRVTYINLIAALRKNDEFLEAVKWSLWLKQIGLCSG